MKSIKSPLEFCSLSSGSKGNCYLIKSGENGILVDAGISAKKISEGLAQIGMNIDNIQGILITHEHSDHTKGIATLTKKYGIPVYANWQTWEALKLNINEEKRLIFETGCLFAIGDIRIKPFPIAHDAVEPVGFSIFKDNVQISTITDTGHISDEMLEEIKNADILVLEANHDVNMLKIGRYPWFLKQRILGSHGHLSNEDAGSTLVKIIKAEPKPRQILLAHLSHENNFPEMAYQTIKNILEEDNLYIGKHFRMNTIIREEISEIYYA